MSDQRMQPLAVPPQDGRVALITGANQGIGYLTALGLVRAGAHVFLGCRDPQRAQTAAEQIERETGRRPEVLPLDLADLRSVERASASFLARDLPLHMLILNAGVVGHSGITRDGFEIAFGTNHLGHFLLTQRLLPRLIASAPARVVTLAGDAHYAVSSIPFDKVRGRTRTFKGLIESARSKLANVSFSAELARRVAGTGVTTYALHPGVFATGIWRQAPAPLRGVVNLVLGAADQGARATLRLATAPELAHESGLHYAGLRERAASRAGRDPVLGRKLWEQSEVWVRDALKATQTAPQAQAPSP